jgi:hypothetical protein
MRSGHLSGGPRQKSAFQSPIFLTRAENTRSRWIEGAATHSKEESFPDPDFCPVGARSPGLTRFDASRRSRDTRNGFAAFFTATATPTALRSSKSTAPTPPLRRPRAVGEQIAFSHGAVSKGFAGAPQENKSSTSAVRWLAIALIVWLAGAVAGLAMMPTKRAVSPEGRNKRPAHRPGDIKSPSIYALPTVV